VVNPKTQKMDYKISLGSYETTNAVARETGDLKQGQRLYHLDGYYPDGGHKTFAMMKLTTMPAYSDVREMVMGVLKGQTKAVSSFTPTSQGGVIQLPDE
jgi:hypothetical protein